MRANSDLPLFEWRPPQCDVIPFPARSRVGKIRRVGDVLEGKTGKGADQYWRQIRDGMRSQMEKAGIPADRIDAELRDFFAAVQAELQRRAGHGQRPGGAA